MGEENNENGGVRGGGPATNLQGGFKQRLYQLRRDKGWSQSELARRVWGTIEDARGYTVAKNRDRVSAYESGRAVPERSNLDALADALEVTVDDLAPDLVSARQSTLGAGSGATGVTMKMLPDGMVSLKVDAVVPLALAVSVIKLLSPENA